VDRRFTTFHFMWRTISYYRRETVTTALAVAICAMVVTGALIVGDSVRGSLQLIAAHSLGQVKTAATAGERWFTTASIASLKQNAVASSPVMVAAITVSAYVSAPETGRSGAVTLYGIDQDFFSLVSRSREEPAKLPVLHENGILLNRSAADHLGLKVGDTAVLRFFRPSGMPGDAPFSLTRTAVETVRRQVVGVVESSAGGDFDPRVAQRLPLNAFVDITSCGELMGNPGRANLVISDGANGLLDRLTKVFRLEDYGLQLQTGSSGFELRSEGVFLSEAIEAAVDSSGIPCRKVFGYFANTLQHQNKSVPYSFIAGIQEPPFPRDGTDSQIVINQWLADQLEASAGANLTVTAFIPGPYGALSEVTHAFTVREVVPLAGPALDRSFMPLFPGMEHAETCDDWDPALPINMARVRPVDEAYWYKYGGLPKAFIRLDRARDIWKNRFGTLTLVRFTADRAEDIAVALQNKLSPSAAGVLAVDLLAEKSHGISHSIDFSLLFGGLGFFIIIAALMLTSLLFRLSLDRRHQELAVLQVIGFDRRRLWRLLLGESLLISIGGTIVGLVLGIAYAAAMIRLLGTVWNSALNLDQITLLVSARSLVLGFLVSVGACLAAAVVSLRGFFAASKAELLSREAEITITPTVNLRLPLVVLILAVVAAILSPGGGSLLTTALFFLAGLAMLVCTTQLAGWLIVAGAGRVERFSLTRLVVKNTVRNFGRSLAVIRVLAGAIFLVLAVSAHHRGPLADPHQPRSGTGGFALYLETAVPVIGDINSAAGRYALKLDDLATGTTIVPLPMIEGSDGSCLNLNRVSRPPVLGVDAARLADRFMFQAVLPGLEKSWRVLEHDCGDPAVIPAIADADVLRWNLGKSLGDEISVESSTGRSYRLRFVAAIDNSVFQGRILIAREQMYRLWPGLTGSRVFLVDSPPELTESVRSTLATALARYGIHVERSAARLAEFSRVQNTYLSIFLVLGSIGLLLGCGGLAVLLHRNLLERRDELSFLRVLGFDRQAVHRLVFGEHALLFGAGVACGVVSAVTAIFPLIGAPAGNLPVTGMITATALVILTGLTALFFGAKADPRV
jgi:ABC-type lipoprotein release transport system permease subunit